MAVNIKDLYGNSGNKLTAILRITQPHVLSYWAWVTCVSTGIPACRTAARLSRLPNRWPIWSFAPPFGLQIDLLFTLWSQIDLLFTLWSQIDLLFTLWSQIDLLFTLWSPNRPTLHPLVPKSTYSSPFGPQIDLLFLALSQDWSPYMFSLRIS